MIRKLRTYYSLMLIATAMMFLAACDSGQGVASQPATTAQSASNAPSAASSQAASSQANPANPVAPQSAPQQPATVAPTNPAPAPTATASGPYRSKLANRGPAPEIHSDTWINSGPVSMASLRGKVVIVEFWTFDCINCKDALPGVKAVYNKYHDQGFAVIGVHSPELSVERDVNNVRQAVKDQGIVWPVPIDGDYKNWNAYKNAYWPAFYVIDKQGNIRSVRVGEGNDAGLMSDVGDLLKEQYLGESISFLVIPTRRR